ncbi:uncharacterized protein BcabD6B2_18300 [Babesia caballi]|uniref:Uncharacterized protein n=1 Tax=Babesia caballi TaxID=5871 RepID=A0AAV4LR88_BABCB|nr:hypothetical protein, conserved [Babesia caballi]
MRSYFDSQGLLPTFVESSRTGAHIAESALNKFSELQQGMTNASSPPVSSATFPYVKFTEALKQEVTKHSSSLPSKCPLSALYHGASCYFQHQQITNAKSAGGTPKTIREMLYFLAALQFSPQYDEFDRYVTGHFKTLTGNKSGKDFELKLQVADSGISTKATEKSGGNTLSAADLKSYITSTFLLPPSLLGWLQEPSTSREPWLYELFCNPAFQFKYPSGAALFSTISNYAYALQFQLSFLYIQCRDTYTKACGWNQCTFGRGVNAAGKGVPSHICKAYNCGDNNVNCSHNGTGGATQCKHNKKDDPTCGTSDNLSPLQAFLTDNLNGFSRGNPGTSDHLAFCSGPMCHVPMGFDGHLKGDKKTGGNLYNALGSFCGGFNTPLRQLSEKLGCLTKRTPRTLGDLFGFAWHLNGQLFNQKFHEPLRAVIQKSTTQTLSTFLTSINALQATSLLSNSIAKLAEVSFWNTPDSYGLASLLAANLFNLNKHCHKEKDGKITHNIGGCTTSPNDMWSLFQPVRAKPIGGSTTDLYDACRKGNCGGYLSPLTHSSGATYAPDHASVYLSWLAYLTDDFHEWFQNLLDEFNNIDCSKTGCRSKAGGKAACTSQHKGTHGTGSDACSCDSVIHCGGVLPVLYRHGFQFYSPHTLSGGNNGTTKRSCDKFHDALSNVLAEGTPLTKLLETIDSFLYAIMWEFFSKLSAFWAVYICIILYTFFFLLDTLRVRSHLHFPSSNRIAPISLLGTGKAPALTKLTKLTYFIP